MTAVRATSPSVALIAGGIVRQTIRHVRRVPQLLRSGGTRDVWRRARGQIGSYRQLIAWNFAVRRRPRQRAETAWAARPDRSR